jgi:hypothetical protein
MAGVRMTEEFQDEIKAWAKKQQDQPALVTAILRMVEIGPRQKKESDDGGRSDSPRALRRNQD